MNGTYRLFTKEAYPLGIEVAHTRRAGRAYRMPSAIPPDPDYNGSFNGHDNHTDDETGHREPPLDII
jgi:hypothetical protein